MLEKLSCIKERPGIAYTGKKDMGKTKLHRYNIITLATKYRPYII